MIKKLLFTVLLGVNLFFASSVFGQAVGDYRSNVNTTGNWTNLTSWQRWNGSSWIEPSAGQGYPAQNIGTGAVLIQAGDVLIVNALNITPVAIGTFTIDGQLVLSDDISLTINTTSLIVTSPSGSILFGKKSDIRLPANTPIQVSTDGLLGDCSNNNSIFLGAVEVAVCAGPGNSMLTFDQVMAGGGFNIVNISPTSASVCGSGSFSFTATAIPSAAATIKWYDAASGGNLLQTGTSGSSSTFISPVISTTTTYYADATVGSFTTPRKAVVATVYSLPTISGSLNVCIGSTTTLTGTATANSATPWVSASTGVATVSSLGVVTGFALGTSVITYKNSNGCDATAIVTVSALNAPTPGPITQPTCALPSGSVVLNELPASGTWTLTRSPGGVTTSGTGTSTTISGLASGTYTYTVSNGSCTSGDSIDVAINATTNTWSVNAASGVGSWTNTLTSAQAITFNGDYNSTGDLTACSCQVNLGVYVNINAGHTLNVTNSLSVEAAGNILFKDKSSLVQINNVINTGTIKYERNVDSLNILETDYTYWSSPVTGFTLGGVYPNNTSGLFYSYGVIAGVEDWRSESLGTIMTAGKGYIINGKKPYSAPMPPPPPPTFIGVPNNGYYEIDAIADRSYLLGNPYPSALDADAFLTDNADVLDGTLYFWTHNTEIQDRNNILSTAGSGAMAYTSNDYATYNLTGGVGIENAKGGVSSPSDPGYPVLPSGVDTGKKPTGKIASGQGFFASTKTIAEGFVSDTPIVYENIMRVGVIDITKEDNSQFFKTKNPSKSSKPIEKNRIWLNLTNTQGAFKQTLVGYITGATNDYDDRFDGESYDGNEFVDFYSVNQDKNLVIQGRALPFDENDEVPLGFRTTINGAFTINIDQVDGFLTNQAVFIEDKLINTVFDLKSGNYTFSTVEGTFDDRFVLRFKDNSAAKTLVAANFDSLEKSVLVSNKSKQIKIDSALEMIDKVAVFDLLGRQIYQKVNVNSKELSIANLVSNRQMLMVKTTLQNGETVTKKILY